MSNDKMINWDIDRKHTEYKDYLRKHGFSSSWTTNDGKRVDLPNTTMWKSGISLDEAYRSMEDAARAVGATLTSAIAVPCDSWKAKITQTPSRTNMYSL